MKAGDGSGRKGGFGAFRDFYFKKQIELENALAEFHRKIANEAGAPVSVRSALVSESAAMRKNVTRIFRDVFVYCKIAIFKSAPPLPHFGKQALASPVNWTFKKDAARCAICGESRSVDIAHIVPRSRGGAGGDENLFGLCPTHHSLFDRHQLSEEEWQKLDFSQKSPAAKEYAETVIKPRLEKYWSGAHQFQ